MSIARVMKLIALTASNNENEARNAAALACRLIREGGFHVVDPRDRASSPPTPPPAPPPPQPSRTAHQAHEDILNDLLRNVRARAGGMPGHAWYGAERERDEYERQRYEDNLRYRRAKAEAQGNESRWKQGRVTQLFEAVGTACWQCKSPFRVLQEIWVHPIYTPLCNHCYLQMVE